MIAPNIGALSVLDASPPLQLLGERSPLQPNWVADDDPNKENTLQSQLDAVLKDNSELNDPNQAYAVVDLTLDDDKTPGFGPQTPAYAGRNDTNPMWIASLAKLLPLYGAYSLLADLALVTLAFAETDLSLAAAGLRDNYGRIKASTPSLRPNIEHMFQAPSSPGGINFTCDNLTNAMLDDYHPLPQADYDPNLSISVPNLSTPLMALECLRLMAGWSDNVAASSVIMALGFDYLWALARTSGLFQRWPKLTRRDSGKTLANGLFVGEDYLEQNNHLWLTAPRGTRPSGPPLGGIISNQVGTARSVALLLTMLARSELVPDQPGRLPPGLALAANVGMREMLRKFNGNFTSAGPLFPNGPEASPIGMGMANAGWTAKQPAWDYTTPPSETLLNGDLAVSKIGVGTSISGKQVMCNGLLVRTTRPDLPDTPITAVLVGINAGTVLPDNLNTFGAAMAMQLDARHGVD